MATAIKHFSGSVGSTGGTSLDWTSKDADLKLCFSNKIDKAHFFTGAELNDSPRFVTFKPDGTRMFITTNATTDGIVSFDLATAWDIESTLSNRTAFNYYSLISATGDSNPVTVWNNDGTQVLIMSNSNAELTYFDLSTAYDVSTMSLGGSIEEISDATTSFVGGCWMNDGNMFTLVSTSGQNLVHYDASTAYDFSTLKAHGSWLDVQSFSDSSYFVPTGTFPNGIFSDTDEDMFITTRDSTTDNSTTYRFEYVVPGKPMSIDRVDQQWAGQTHSSNTTEYFTPNGDYHYFIDIGGSFTSSYGGTTWLFRAPLSHTVAADSTIYTVPTGKVAKVKFNLSGQSANVYVGSDKIASLKGGGSIRATSDCHKGLALRGYEKTAADPNYTFTDPLCAVDFFARGGRTMNIDPFNVEGPEYFMLSAGESLILKNSVNVNYDIQVIEDNATS
jgi:hypothetical protein